MKQVISTPNAPAAVGTYSQAIVANGRGESPSYKGFLKVHERGRGNYKWSNQRACQDGSVQGFKGVG